MFYFISHFYGTPFTGGEKYNFKFVETLLKQGYPVKIYTDEKISPFFKKNYILYNFWYLARLFSFKQGFLFIDSYMHPRLFIFLYFLKLFTRTKVVGTVHHFYWCSQNSKFSRLLDKIIEKLFIARFDYLIVPSKYTADSVMKLVKGVSSKINIIYPGIDLYMTSSHYNKRQYTQGHQLKLLYVGGIQKRKGVGFLIDALNIIKDNNLLLYLVGDLDKEPEYFDNIKKSCHNYGLQSRVRFCGRISDSELKKLYAESDIFILPSLQEGFGIVIIEAMQFGLPIIASNVTSIPEIVQDDKNGILVPPGNSKKLAEAIDKLTFSTETRKIMGESSGKLAKNFNTWEDVELQFLELIHLLQGSKL